MRPIIRQLLFLPKKKSSAFPGLTRRYRLNNSFLDEFGGSSLVPAGGTISANGYNFPLNMGLSLSNAIVPNNYSILLDFQLANVNAYAKIIDYANRTINPGIFINASRVGFDGGGGYSSAVVSINTPFRLIVTMSSILNSTSLYVNGALARGSLSPMLFGAANNIIWFFRSESTEASAGVVTQIAIFNRPLAPTEITTLGTVNTPF